MAENVCAGHSGITVRVNTLEKRVDGHDARLDAGEARMDDIEKEGVSADERIKALCVQISGLITVIKVAVGVVTTVMVGAVPLIIWLKG